MKACFFDLDGTLVDSIDLIVACFQHTTQTHLGNMISRAEVLSHIGLPLRPLLESMSPGNGDRLIETYRTRQFELHDSLVKPYVGMAELLHTLKENGVHLGVVTSKAKAGTEKALALFGNTAAVFETIITIDDCQNHKPHPEPLLKAAQITGCSPQEAAYVGDTHYDMQAAKSASMTPVGITWGVASKDTLGQYTPHVFDHIPQLSDFLLQAAQR